MAGGLCGPLARAEPRTIAVSWPQRQKREIIESGPPPGLPATFHELFGALEARTTGAAKTALDALGWR